MRVICSSSGFSANTWEWGKAGVSRSRNRQGKGWGEFVLMRSNGWTSTNQTNCYSASHHKSHSHNNHITIAKWLHTANIAKCSNGRMSAYRSVKSEQQSLNYYVPLYCVRRAGCLHIDPTFLPSALGALIDKATLVKMAKYESCEEICWHHRHLTLIEGTGYRKQYALCDWKITRQSKRTGIG
jgi:hypothetical protein